MVAQALARALAYGGGARARGLADDVICMRTLMGSLSQALEGYTVLQGRTVSFGFLKTWGGWYRAVMSAAVCAFFAWVNFVARSHAQRTGKARALRKKRLQVQAKHSRGPIYVAAAEHKTVTDRERCTELSGGEQAYDESACAPAVLMDHSRLDPCQDAPRSACDVLPAL